MKNKVLIIYLVMSLAFIIGLGAAYVIDANYQASIKEEIASLGITEQFRGVTIDYEKSIEVDGKLNKFLLKTANTEAKIMVAQREYKICFIYLCADEVDCQSISMSEFNKYIESNSIKLEGE